MSRALSRSEIIALEVLIDFDEARLVSSFFPAVPGKKIKAAISTRLDNYRLELPLLGHGFLDMNHFSRLELPQAVSHLNEVQGFGSSHWVEAARLRWPHHSVRCSFVTWDMTILFAGEAVSDRASLGPETLR
jgi:hypothetical protein